MPKFAFKYKNMKRKGILYLLLLFVFIVIICVVLLLRAIYGSNIKTGNSNLSIFIPSGSTFEQVFDSINSKVSIENPGLFKWIAKKKKYPSDIKPGRYVINWNMSYLKLINMLRSGNQTPVKVTFNNIRTLNELAGKIGNQIEADSAHIIAFLNNSDNYKADSFTSQTIISVFIPNTYELYWNTSAEGFYVRMLKEYRKFWNEERIAKAREKNLTPIEVAILASIIDDEVAKADEKPRIAGVYLNRLKKGIPLQACPTIKFALNDFTITRILNKYLLVDSPYNTYIHNGFPPGPIGLPSIEGLNAVLNSEKHDYLFFVAKADFSGYHNFSKTLAEHNKFAALYQKELDKRKIFK
jgi:UPF0755 protein